MSVQLGPIWRSTRRSRTFLLQVLEVAIGFVIVGNLAMTERYYSQIATPPSGHREADVLEVVSRIGAHRLVATERRGPNDLAQAAEERRRHEAAALLKLAGVRAAVPVSATQVDDRWSVPSVFWSDAGPAVPPSACPGVGRAAGGEVVGWTVETAPALAGAVDLAFVEGGFAEGDLAERASADRAPAGTQASPSVVITRCLRDALFGGAPALGRTLYSNRFPPARISGVVADVRMRVPFLYHTEVTALFVAPPPDERVARYLVRVEPGRSKAVAAAIPAALGGGDPDHIVAAGLFAAGRARTAGIGVGTVIVLGATTAALGIVAILGNLAIAAFLVGERRRIIGVRRALGATRPQILRYLLLETLIPTQIGNLVGLVAVLVMVPAAQRRFAGLHLEPIDMLATAFLLSLAGVAARLLPALRATRIPPSEASRSL